MFNGRNISLGMPEELVEIVNYLNEKTSTGEFEFSNSVSYWEDKEHIIESFSYDKHRWYFAVALAYITYLMMVILFSIRLITLGDGLGHLVLFQEYQIGPLSS